MEDIITADQTERPNYEREIIGIITGNLAPKTVQQRLDGYHGNDIASVLEDLDSNSRRKLFRICKATMVAEILEYADEDKAGEYINEMDLGKAAAVMGELETDTAAALLHTIDRDKRTLIIDALRPDIRDEIRLVASFDEDEIGSHLTTNFIEITDGLTIKQAMSELIRQAKQNDNISTIFVTDEEGGFCGAIDIKDLIIARSDDDLKDIIVTSFPYLYANETIDDCIEKLKSWSEDSIPVLDNSNRLIGIITSQSVIEVVDDEMGEDYAMFAGLTAEEDLHEPLLMSMKKRLPWLLILLALGSLVSGVVGAFEDMRYRDGRLAIERGDLLLLYTDGVTEARDPQGSFFGEEGLRETVLSERLAGTRGLIGRILDGLDSFTGNSLEDDVALVSLVFDEVG